jgi:hypothetical protein
VSAPGAMAFLFGRRQRSGSDLAKSTKDLLLRLIKEEGQVPKVDKQYSITYHALTTRPRRKKNSHERSPLPRPPSKALPTSTPNLIKSYSWSTPSSPNLYSHFSSRTSIDYLSKPARTRKRSYRMFSALGIREALRASRMR